MKFTYINKFIYLFFLQFLISISTHSMETDKSASSSSGTKVPLISSPPILGTTGLLNVSFSAPMLANMGGMDLETIRKNGISLPYWNAFDYGAVSTEQEAEGGSSSTPGLSLQDFITDLLKRNQKNQKHKQVGIQALKIQFRSGEAFSQFIGLLGSKSLEREVCK